MATGERTQVWLRPPAIEKLDRVRALIQIDQGGDVMSRPEAIEEAIDRLLLTLHAETGRG